MAVQSFKTVRPIDYSTGNTSASDAGMTLAEHIASTNPHPNASIGGGSSSTSTPVSSGDVGVVNDYNTTHVAAENKVANYVLTKADHDAINAHVNGSFSSVHPGLFAKAEHYHDNVYQQKVYGVAGNIPVLTGNGDIIDSGVSFSGLSSGGGFSGGDYTLAKTTNGTVDYDNLLGNYLVVNYITNFSVAHCPVSTPDGSYPHWVETYTCIAEATSSTLSNPYFAMQRVYTKTGGVYERFGTGDLTTKVEYYRSLYVDYTHDSTTDLYSYSAQTKQFRKAQYSSETGLITDVEDGTTVLQLEVNEGAALASNVSDAKAYIIVQNPTSAWTYKVTTEYNNNPTDYPQSSATTADDGSLVWEITNLAVGTVVQLCYKVAGAADSTYSCSNVLNTGSANENKFVNKATTVLVTIPVDAPENLTTTQVPGLKIVDAGGTAVWSNGTAKASSWHSVLEVAKMLDSTTPIVTNKTHSEKTSRVSKYTWGSWIQLHGVSGN